MNANVLVRSLCVVLFVAAAADSSAQGAPSEPIWNAAQAIPGADVTRETARLRRIDSPTRLSGHYIVVLKDSAVSEMLARRAAVDVEDAVGIASRDLTYRYGGSVGFEYAYALQGFSVSGIDDAKASRLANDPTVDYVEADQSVELSQVASWGLDRVDQRDLPLSNTYTAPGTGATANVYVIDSGIHAHNDFGSRLKAGFTAVNDGHGTDDCAGHGTFVAGIIGGTTYGVAKGVNLYPVRVFGCDASSTPAGCSSSTVECSSQKTTSPAST